LLTQARGVSVIHETVYEDRFGYTRALVRMGANIDVAHACLGRKPCRFADQDFNHSCIVKGVTPLTAQDMVIPDLRAGFANIIAALIAEGVSNIHGIKYIERGYAQVAEKLASVGAAIQVREESNSATPARELASVS
jgi:UDP-N-acetylglucosamine 1-carboxyvinyltransferase